MTNPTPPKLHRRTYWVWMNTPATDTEPAGVAEAVPVEVRYADQLRGELEVAKQGLSMANAPMHVATVWIWCAMVRTGQYGDKFLAFKNTDLAELEPVADPDEDPDSETPDPT